MEKANKNFEKIKELAKYYKINIQINEDLQSKYCLSKQKIGDIEK